MAACFERGVFCDDMIDAPAPPPAITIADFSLR